MCEVVVRSLCGEAWSVMLVPASSLGVYLLGSREHEEGAAVEIAISTFGGQRQCTQPEETHGGVFDVVAVERYARRKISSWRHEAGMTDATCV